MSSIKKVSLVDQVYQILRQDIITLKRPLGSKLNVNELQFEIGVSCTPIREAINRLQQEGLVVYENNVGAHILTLNEHDIEEILEITMTLHKAAIRMAIKKGNISGICRDLKQYLEEYKQAKTAQQEVLAINHFVGTFYKNCGNRRLDNSMISIQGQQLLLRYIYGYCLDERASNLDDFIDMYEGAKAQDAERVCDALQRNAERAWPYYRQFLSKQG